MFQSRHSGLAAGSRRLRSPSLKNLVIVIGILMIYVTWDERHHLGGDRQGGDADGRHDLDHVLSAGQVRLQLVRPAWNHSREVGQRREAFLQPGLLYGKDLVGKFDFLSLALALVLGTAGLPHILIRFYPTPTVQAACKSVLWAIGLIGSFYLMTLVRGSGAAALVDTGKGSRIQTSAGNAASPLLAQAVGGGEGTASGSVLLALISAVAFAAILAIVGT